MIALGIGIGIPFTVQGGGPAPGGPAPALDFSPLVSALGFGTNSQYIFLGVV